MQKKYLKYEDFLMACLGDIEERWKIISAYKDEIESECGNNENLKLEMILDLEKSFDEIDEQYDFYIKNMYK